MVYSPVLEETILDAPVRRVPNARRYFDCNSLKVPISHSRRSATQSKGQASFLCIAQLHSTFDGVICRKDASGYTSNSSTLLPLLCTILLLGYEDHSA